MTPSVEHIGNIWRDKSHSLPGTVRWWSGWTMLRWPYRRSAPPRSTPLLSSREKRTTFRRENLFSPDSGDDFFQSLCKNLERTESKKWLNETLEILMKVMNEFIISFVTPFTWQERAPDEQKEESKKLKAIIERHKNLIPKVQETLVKTECYWKCYSYGD